jgi:hypothetical protein
MRKEILSVITTIIRQRRKAILIAAVVIAFLAVIIPIASWLNITTNVNFPSAGYIRTTGVKAYWDSALQNETRKIQWGTLYIGSKTNVTIYLRSISNVNATLGMKTENWTFSDSNSINISEPADRQSYMYLTWNYTNSIIQPNQVIPVTLTLVLEDNMAFIEFLIQNDIRAFNFDIGIYTI